MKNFVCTLFILLSFYSYSQERNKHINRIEFSIIPALLYNYTHLGYSIQTNQNEHAIFLSSYYWELPPSFNLNFSYNYNRYLNNKKLYIPYWFRISNTRRIIGYEEGYHPHTLRFSVGSGIGTHLTFAKRFGFRAELGLGAGLNLTNNSGAMFPYRMDFTNYSFDQLYPKHNPPILPAVRIKIGFSIALGKGL